MKLWLAPLEGVSDCAFRTLCYRHGADLTFTEMIRADSLVRSNKSTLALYDLKNDTPTVVQLLVIKPDIAKKFVNMQCSLSGTPAGFNLNLGCPSPEIIRQGGGAALTKRIQRVQELVAILKKSGLPITLKIRLGLNEYEKKHKVYLKLMQNVDADAFIVHARHARQLSREPADWSVFKDCLVTGKHIIPNGDIAERGDIHFFEKLGVKEVMIGRAAVRNPSIFAYLKGGSLLPIDIIKREYVALCEQFHNHPKYKTNVLAYLGKTIGSKKWLM